MGQFALPNPSRYVDVECVGLLCRIINKNKVFLTVLAAANTNNQNGPRPWVASVLQSINVARLHGHAGAQSETLAEIASQIEVNPKKKKQMRRFLLQGTFDPYVSLSSSAKHKSNYSSIHACIDCCQPFATASQLSSHRFKKHCEVARGTKRADRHPMCSVCVVFFHILIRLTDHLSKKNRRLGDPNKCILTFEAHGFPS